MKTLGQTLKEAREIMPFTLRQVEEGTGVSNAYLSQLENDKIRKPSASVLYKLASFYNINLNTLLYAAGIIKDPPPKGSTVLDAAAFNTFKITPEEEQKLLDFLKYLRYSQKKQ